MRRLALIVGLAFTLVVPRVHAQAPVYTFGVSPLVAPHHPALAPGGRLGARVPPEILGRAWADSVLARRLPPLGSLFAAASPPVVSAAVSPAAAAPAPLDTTPPAAQLGMDLNLRLELKADQFRNLHCTSQELQVTLSGCSSGFPTITPNPQYAIRTAGVVGQRLHVDVDFDSSASSTPTTTCMSGTRAWRTKCCAAWRPGTSRFRPRLRVSSPRAFQPTTSACRPSRSSAPSSCAVSWHSKKATSSKTASTPSGP